MAFKRPPTNVATKVKSEEKFIQEARGETTHDISPHAQDSKPLIKAMNIPLPIKTIERIKQYQSTQARKFETQSYIFNEAINAWLDSKKFD
ncbi:hypothetical protein CQA53_08945 [Helicobacter didelphidarum]|uniref:Uncharacterized protein n=1 Tax=Helicobacter didelphidarum TaxID=2040648 RepID=A0A3D8IDU4_9HELI|nr:hypothetical protein [Helicobacter didelphidarum]RDU62934.1 hypothetical protein CQA53_08945 [Helicobacter didelphidarum]